jgi:SAM-dependent methyltransferase
MTKHQVAPEWASIDSHAMQYHTAQWDTPKRSTHHFLHFIAPRLNHAKKVLDIGAGAGGATSFFAKATANVKFTALDCSLELLDLGRAKCKDLENIEFSQGDLFDLEFQREYDGCISLQTLSWLPNYHDALRSIFQGVSPDWFACSSLFYDGEINCTIEVDEISRGRKTWYNCYSIPAVKRYAESLGYTLSRWEPFDIDIDIPKPETVDLMSTYTIGVANTDNTNKKRLQVSGPLLLNWHFLMFEKIL